MCAALLTLELCKLYLNVHRTPQRAEVLLEKLTQGDDLAANEARALLNSMRR